MWLKLVSQSLAVSYDIFRFSLDILRYVFYYSVMIKIEIDIDNEY